MTAQLYLDGVTRSFDGFKAINGLSLRFRESDSEYVFLALFRFFFWSCHTGNCSHKNFPVKKFSSDPTCPICSHNNG